MPKKGLLSIIYDPSLRGRVIMVLVIITIMVIAILLSGPKITEVAENNEVASNDPTQTSENFLQLPGITNVESASEYPITTGVIVGAAAVLLIIEIGTWIELKRQS